MSKPNPSIKDKNSSSIRPNSCLYKDSYLAVRHEAVAVVAAEVEEAEVVDVAADAADHEEEALEVVVVVAADLAEAAEVVPLMVVVEVSNPAVADSEEAVVDKCVCRNIKHYHAFILNTKAIYYIQYITIFV